MDRARAALDRHQRERKAMSSPTSEQIVIVAGMIVTLASILANYVPPITRIGRALHWIALNGRGIQQAVKPTTKK